MITNKLGSLFLDSIYSVSSGTWSGLNLLLIALLEGSSYIYEELSLAIDWLIPKGRILVRNWWGILLNYKLVSWVEVTHPIFNSQIHFYWSSSWIGPIYSCFLKDVIVFWDVINLRFIFKNFLLAMTLGYNLRRHAWVSVHLLLQSQRYVIINPRFLLRNNIDAFDIYFFGLV